MAPLRLRAACVVAVSVTIALIATGPAWAEAAGATLEDLSFLAGSWSRCTGDAEYEEVWLPARGGLMLGLNRTVRTAGKSAFEYLRIEEDANGVTYLASPQGRAATPFALVELAPGKAVFENPEHDFPTRIIYRLNADGTLTARIEGLVDGELQGSEWHWVRGPCAE